MKCHRVLLILLLYSVSSFGSVTGATDHLLIAAVQFPEMSHQSEGDFLNMMTEYIKNAKAQKVQIIVFPELHTLNLLANSDSPSVEHLDGLAAFKDKYQSYLLQQAKANHMIIVGGTTLTRKGGRFYNTVLVAFPNGQIKMADKSLLTPWELTHHITGIGESKTPLNFETPWGKVAVLICYESESPQIISMLTSINPDLVLIPSNTNQIAGLDRVKAAMKYIAVAQFSYTLLTGVTTGYTREQVGKNDVGQAIFASPPELFETNIDKEGLFNKPYLFIVDVDKRSNN